MELRWLRRTYHEGRYRKVLPMLKEGNLLDVGCGRPCEAMPDGAFLKAAKRGTGLDIADLQGADFEFRRGSLLALPFADDSFDNVVAMEVLEHVEDVHLALREIRRVLKEDGVFVMSTPDCTPAWNLFWRVWERSVGHMWEGEHVTELDKAGWVELVGQHFHLEEARRHWGVDIVLRARKPRRIAVAAPYAEVAPPRAAR